MYQQCVDEILVIIVVVGFIGLIVNIPSGSRETGSRQCLPGLSPRTPSNACPRGDSIPQFTQSLPLFVGYPEALIHNLMQVGVQGAYLNAVCHIGVWLVIRALTAPGSVVLLVAETESSTIAEGMNWCRSQACSSALIASPTIIILNCWYVLGLCRYRWWLSMRHTLKPVVEGPGVDWWRARTRHNQRRVVVVGGEREEVFLCNAHWIIPCQPRIVHPIVCQV